MPFKRILSYTGTVSPVGYLANIFKVLKVFFLLILMPSRDKLDEVAVGNNSHTAFNKYIAAYCTV